VLGHQAQQPQIAPRPELLEPALPGTHGAQADGATLPSIAHPRAPSTALADSPHGPCQAPGHTRRRSGVRKGKRAKVPRSSAARTSSPRAVVAQTPVVPPAPSVSTGDASPAALSPPPIPF